MDWIYISPHLDDAALSLGGLIWDQSQSGEEVSIWTICAGDPPPGNLSSFAETLHERWETGREGVGERREEDVLSCRRLGAFHRHFEVPDCIYRLSPKTGKHLYDSEDSLWGQVHPDEVGLVIALSEEIRENLPPRTRVVCPLTLGNHVDHELTRAAAEMAFKRLNVSGDDRFYYYAEYPYVLASDMPLDEIKDAYPHKVSQAGMLAWQEAVAAHRSQISTFWNDLDEMRAGLQSYYDLMGGIWLWK
jgi:LmbE family N-acetylglucosaminyl deacetylase